MVHGYRSWEKTIRKVYSHFKRFEDERALLRNIDTEIISGRVNGELINVERLLLNSLKQVCLISGLTGPALCYVFTGKELILLQEDPLSDAHPSTLHARPFITHLSRTQDGADTSIIVTRDDVDANVFQGFANFNTMLLYPMYSPPSSTQLLCVFVLLDQDVHEGSYLCDAEFQAFLASVVNQLSIAYHHCRVMSLHCNMQHIWDLFLSSSLSPHQCFRGLARAIPRFLPSLRPLRLPVDPEVQILVPDRPPSQGKPRHLRIRATTGDEPDTTRIDISDSICGMLIEKPPVELPFFCDDPRKPEYGKRYKSYLARNANDIKTEFAIRLIREGTGLVGILNLESELPNAFGVQHQEAIRSIEHEVAAMVDTFERRLQVHSEVQHAIASVTSTYLDGLARTFGHSIDQPLLSLKYDCDLLTGLIEQDLSKEMQVLMDAGTVSEKKRARSVTKTGEALTRAKSTIERLTRTCKNVGEIAGEFSRDMRDYGTLGRWDLQELVGLSISLAKKRLFQEKGQIRIVTEPPNEKPLVFCSPLIRQHLYSIIDNAVKSIEDRLMSDPAEGVITVSIVRNEIADLRQERDLNREWLMQVRDNGTGVNEEQLKELRRFVMGTRFRADHGHGQGLVAAQRYLASIGGRLEIDGHPGCFEVRMFLSEYQEHLHAHLSWH